jgi:hypothetical protein
MDKPDELCAYFIAWFTRGAERTGTIILERLGTLYVSHSALKIQPF